MKQFCPPCRQLNRQKLPQNALRRRLTCWISSLRSEISCHARFAFDQSASYNCTSGFSTPTADYTSDLEKSSFWMHLMKWYAQDTEEILLGQYTFYFEWKLCCVLWKLSPNLIELTMKFGFREESFFIFLIGILIVGSSAKKLTEATVENCEGECDRFCVRMWRTGLRNMWRTGLHFAMRACLYSKSSQGKWSCSHVMSFGHQCNANIHI